MDVHMDDDFDMPGGDDFEDVTNLFYLAARDLAPEEIVLTEGFSLNDAMSAFEIGEPRMDSGMVTAEDNGLPFDPLAPLLPEEVCWIMDRMFACEMSWHAGNTLSQTVFTLLYVHELSDLNPDLLPQGWPAVHDPHRPLELVTIVLRAAVFGLLKSCDLAWREFSRKRIHDIEDWQSEKCEVSLLEGVPHTVVIRRLDEACRWLHTSDIPEEVRDALLYRLILRRHILEILMLSVSEDLDPIRSHTTVAFNTLQRVQNFTPSLPSAGSPALSVFDLRVSRRLHTVIPIRVVELPAQMVVWSMLQRLFQDFEALDYMRDSYTITSWKVFGAHSLWSPKRSLPSSYIRSLMQGTFYDRQVVMDQYPSAWLINQFFLETMGAEYDGICQLLITSWAGGDSLYLQDLETDIIKVVSEHVKSFWYNPPRRRRHLMKSILELQSLQDAFQVLQDHIVVSNPHSVRIIKALPEAANIWKLGIAREIILSGFQQDLYAPHERPFAYWFVSQIIDQHLHSLETLQSHGPVNILVQREWQYQTQFLSTIQMMCIGLCSMTSTVQPPPAFRASLNFRRRYKWLFASSNGDTSEPLFHIPPISRYLEDTEELKSPGGRCSRDSFELAEHMITRLLATQCQTLCGSEEARMRLEFAQNLSTVNSQLLDLARRVSVHADSASLLAWDANYHPWFPKVRYVADKKN